MLDPTSWGRRSVRDNVDPNSSELDCGVQGCTDLPYQHLAVVNTLLALALEEGLPGLLREAPVVTSRTLGLGYSEVMELLPGGERLLLRSAVGWNNDLVDRLTVEAVPGSRMEFALKTGRPVLVPDSRQEHGFECTPTVSPGLVCGISTPSGSGECPFGILSVHGSLPRTFMPEEIGFVQEVARVIGKATNMSRTTGENIVVGPPETGKPIIGTTTIEDDKDFRDSLTERTKRVIAINRFNPNIDITPRQYETLTRIAPDKTYPQIAREMGIDDSTVRSHVYKLRKALGANSKLEIVRRARELGLFDPSS